MNKSLEQVDSRGVSVLRAAVIGLNNSRNSPVSVSCWQLVQGVPANSSGLRPTHYWSTAKKLVEDLINQNIIGYAGKQRASSVCRPILLRSPGECHWPSGGATSRPLLHRVLKTRIVESRFVENKVG
jgi:hypothetical protein